MQSYIQTRMAQMGSFVADAASSQTQFLTSISSDVSAFKGKKTSDLASITEQVPLREAR